MIINHLNSDFYFRQINYKYYQIVIIKNFQKF